MLSASPRWRRARRSISLLFAPLLAGWLPACAASLPPGAQEPGQSRTDAVEAAERAESREETLPLAEQGGALRKVLLLRGSQEPSDRAVTEVWIGAHLGFFARAYASDPSAVRAIPASAPFHRAEEDFARWVGATRPDREDRSFARILFELPVDALPGLDRFAMGADALGMLHDDGASIAFLHYCASSEALATRLAHLLATSDKDGRGKRKLFADLLAYGGKDIGPIWAASVVEPSVWSAAIEAFAEADEPLDASPLCGVIREGWARWPDRRGALLFVLEENARFSKGFYQRGPASFPCAVSPVPVPADVVQMLALYPDADEQIEDIWDIVGGPNREEALAFALAARWPSGPVNRYFDALHRISVHEWKQTDPAGLEQLRRSARSAGLAVGPLPGEGELEWACMDNDYAARPECVRIKRAEEAERRKRCRDGWCRCRNRC